MLLCLNREFIFQGISEKNHPSFIQDELDLIFSFKIWKLSNIFYYIVLKNCLTLNPLVYSLVSIIYCLLLFYTILQKGKRMKIVIDLLIEYCIPFTTFIPRANKGKQQTDSCVYCLRNTRDLLRRKLQFSVVSAATNCLSSLYILMKRERGKFIVHLRSASKCSFPLQ